MTIHSLALIGLYLTLLLLCVKPLGRYIAQVYLGKLRFLRPLERLLYRLSGVNPHNKMNWQSYLLALLIFNLLGLIAVFILLRLQAILPLNPQNFSAVPPDLSFNIAASFVTNTNWQAYSGENTLSYLSQSLALTVQNFLSAATGMSVVIVLIRGLTKQKTTRLGNFWVDLVRGTLYIFLPLSLLLAIFLSSQGVIQNFLPYQKVNLIQSISYQQKTITEQIIPMGPVASQIAIKQLGSNGGGFFNANAAHPFENPTPLSNFLQMLAILFIPAALCYTFGIMVHDTRQGWAIFSAMLILLIPLLCCTVALEQHGNLAFTPLGIDQHHQPNFAPGGNMEGKEIRFGITPSAIWATVTTATSNGSVNAMLDSFTPLGGMISLWLMHLGEVVFGGVGSGLYSMLMLVILTVFIAGLMVGRTPEYLGKKIEPFEMKMAAVAILVMPILVLILGGISVVSPFATHSIANPGTHGLTEILYAFSSMANNNGSAFAGLNTNTVFYNIAGGFAMLISRFTVAAAVLAIAGSLAKKKTIPPSIGTLPTHTPLFIILLIFVTLIIGALTFFPVTALGPIAEYLMSGAH